MTKTITATYVTTNIRLVEKDWRRLKLMAAKQGRSMSALTRRAINNFLNWQNDPIWKLPQQAVTTKDPHLSQKIDKIVYQ